MNHFRVRFLFVLAIGASSTLNAVVPYYSIRSQSVDAARELMGWAHKVNLYDMEKLYGTFAVTLEGTGSFRPNYISESLFGIGGCGMSNFSTVATSTLGGCCVTGPCCDGLQVVVSGSQVLNRGSGDWLADYFGLSPSYNGILSFKPRVTSFLADFNLYVGLDEWLCGSYFRIHAPVVWTKWDLHACETVAASYELGYPAGYFGPVYVPPEALVQRALDYFQNAQVPLLGGGVTFNPLSYATFACKGESKVALAEIQMALGWNFWMDENYHFGLNFRVYAPTGNRPTGLYLFEPMVGNGKSWELGGGLTSHYTFWRSEDEDSSFGLYIDANFTTLLRADQVRTFDLTGRPLSRYMLAEKLSAPVNNLYANTNPNTSAGSIAPSGQFVNILTPVANLTTVAVKVRSNLQADVVAQLNYTNCNFEFDLGYDFWARTCEKIDLDCCCPTALLDGQTWVLKGDASVYGFAQSSVCGAIATQAIPLSASESNATINSGTNYPYGAPGYIAQQNPNIDNPKYATQCNDGTSAANILYQPSGSSADQIFTSLQPVYLNEAFIGLNAARTQGMSHKIFAHVSYTWRDNECWLPYLGVGGKAEFAAQTKNDGGCCGNTAGLINCNPIASGQLPACQPFEDSDCGGCQRANLSEWGVWLKGGISFQ